MRLTSQRLSLRPLEEGDLENFYRIVTDPFVRKYLFDDVVLSVLETAEFLSESSRTFAEYGWGLWLILENDSSKVVGFAGLRVFFGEDQPQLLYALLPEFTGQGFATEAASAIIDFSFSQLGFDHIEASCDEPNTASRRVAERLGMTRTKGVEKDGVRLVYFTVERG